MANTNVFETKLSNRMQVTRYSTPVYAALASFEERANMVNGQAVVRPTFGRLYADSYTRGSDLTAQNYTETSETLTINTTKALLLPVDNFDIIQHKSNIQQRLADDGMKALNKQIDADFLAEVANATSVVDASLFGGSSGSPISLDQSNVVSIYGAALRALQAQDIDITGGVDPRPQAGNMKPGGQGGAAVLSPWFYEQFVLSQSGRETSDGDMVGKNGYMSKYFGFDNYVSTNGYWTGTLTIATQPTDGDTVTVNGVVFTFKTTLGSTAGNVLIGASADSANTNLTALINTPGTTTSEGVALSAANIRLLNRITATANTTPNTMTLVAKGFGHVVTSETLTAAADIWSLETSHQLFGQKGAIDMVVQDKVSVQVSDIPAQLGKYIKPNVLYGLKTFTEGAQALVDVKIDSSTWA